MKTTTNSSSCQVFSWQRISVLKEHFALYADDRTLAVLQIGGLVGSLARLDVGDYRLVFLGDGLADRTSAYTIVIGKLRWPATSAAGGATEEPCGWLRAVGCAG